MHHPQHAYWRRALLTSCVLASLVGMSGCDPSKPQFVSIDITGADYARAFRLTDQQGQVRSLDDFKGKVVAVFFGYTQCPDVCPTTLTDMVEIKRQLGADGDRLQGLHGGSCAGHTRGAPGLHGQL
jgi:protein SCO1/2